MSDAHPPSSDPLRFEALLDALRNHGFGVGLGEYVRVQQLIGAWQGAMTPGQVKRLIAPLIARSADEQGRFYALFDEVYPLFAPRGVETVVPEAEPDPLEEALPASEIAPATIRWRRPALAAVLVLAVAAGSLWILRRDAPTPDSGVAAGEGPTEAEIAATTPQQGAATSETLIEVPAETPVEAPEPPTQVPAGTPIDQAEASPGEDASAELDAAADRDVASDPAPVQPPSAAEPPVDEPATGGAERQARPPVLEPSIPRERWLQLLALAVPFLLLAIFEWRARRRRRTVLESHRSRRPPISWQAFPKNVGETPFDPGEIREAARNLRRREPGESVSLSIPETIRATIAARGFPTLHFRSHPRVPEYLALVERAGARDHQAHLFDRLLAELAAEEVPMSTRYFESDPRWLARRGRERSLALRDVQGRSGSARLLVFSDGSGLLDPVTGRLESWVESSIDWPHRALFTPTPPDRWGAREAELARHFVVVPATVEGVRAIFELFDPDTDSSGLRWETGRARSRWVASPDPSAAELEVRLSPVAFRWLCACAIYPELHWGLTLRLAQLPSLGVGVLEEENILELVRLPWFRSGRIPDGTRAELIERLPRPVEEEVRRELVRLLSGNPAPTGSVAGEDQQIQLALQRFLAAGRDRRERRRARRELRRFPEEAVTRDLATARVVQARTRSPIQLQLPETLRQLLYAGGLRVLGWRTATRVAATGLIAFLGVGMLQTREDSGDLLAAGTIDAPDECATFGPQYNQGGTCFDQPPALLGAPVVPLTPDFTEAPSATRLAILVDQSGTPTMALVVGGSGTPRFDRLAQDHARAGAYRPAVKDGEPVSGWMEEAFLPGVVTSLPAPADEEGEGELRIDQTGVSLFPDETLALSSLLLPGGIDPGAVSWRSLGTDVARIDASGRLVAVRPGQAQLEASTPGGQRGMLTIDVMSAAFAVSATEFYLTPGSGRSIQVTSTVSGQPLAADRVDWSSSDEAIVTVSPSGEITAVASGTARVTASTAAGDRMIAVTVHPPLRFLAGDPDPAAAVVVPLGADREFQAALLTEDMRLVQSVPIRWTVEDSSILAFDPVTYRASGRTTGSTRLTAQSPDGTVSAGWTVDVVRGELRAESRDVRVGTDEPVRVGTYIASAGVPVGSAGGVRWTSLDNSVVTANADGTLVPQGWGRTSVTVVDDLGRADTVQVTVAPNGDYRYSGLLRQSVTGGRLDFRVSGVVSFRPIDDEIEASIVGCGASLRTAVSAGTWSLSCRNVSLEFRLRGASDLAGSARGLVRNLAASGGATCTNLAGTNISCGVGGVSVERGTAEGDLTVRRFTEADAVVAGATPSDVAAGSRPGVTSLEITLGQTAALSVRLPDGASAPAGASVGRWSSLDSTVARVSTDGIVTGLGWGRTGIVLAGDGARSDTVAVSVMPSGRYRYEGTLGSPGTPRTVIEGEIEFVPIAGGSVATIEGCGSQIVTEPDETFSFECGTTLRFGLTPPSGITGWASQSVGPGVPGGPIRTEMYRECAEVNIETGACIRYEWRRRAGVQRTERISASGNLVVQKVP